MPLTVPFKPRGSFHVPHNAQFPCFLLFFSEEVGNLPSDQGALVHLFRFSLFLLIEFYSFLQVLLCLKLNEYLMFCIAVANIIYFTWLFTFKLSGTSICKSYWVLWIYFIYSISSKSLSGYLSRTTNMFSGWYFYFFPPSPSLHLIFFFSSFLLISLELGQIGMVAMDLCCLTSNRLKASASQWVCLSFPPG